MNTTRADVELAAARLSRCIDTAALANRYGPGRLAVDYYNPGDNPRAYKIVWIADDTHGEYEPFGSLRRRASEMVDTIQFLVEAYYSGAIRG